jgi:hypothetical protein
MRISRLFAAAACHWLSPVPSSQPRRYLRTEERHQATADAPMFVCCASTGPCAPKQLSRGQAVSRAHIPRERPVVAPMCSGWRLPLWREW